MVGLGQHTRTLLRAAATTVPLVVFLPLAAPAAESIETGLRLEVNAMEYPWSAIGRVNVGGRGHCTGFLIGERTVLTAAHCLYDRREGRWRAPGEVHFVAGYQRDTYLIHSPVSRYERDRRFDFAAGATVENAVLDWAVLELAQPIGRQAGWLGLRRLDGALGVQLRRGQARLVQAGYRQGRSNIMSASFDCAVKGFFNGDAGILHSCNLAKGDSGSPLLVFADNEVRVTGIHVINARSDLGETAGALSVVLFHDERGSPQAVAAARRGGAPWSNGRPPTDGGPATPAPLRTIDLLLSTLGLLSPSVAINATARQAAIAAFQREAGLAVSGAPSVALLSRLVLAVP